VILGLLGCAATLPPPVVEPPVHPVDPAFIGEVDIPGARVEYYTVAGRDDIEVWAAIRAAAPRIGGEAHGAETRWAIDWTWPDGGACTPVTVTADIVVRFPRWDPPADAPAHAVGNWQRYVRALAHHERGHVDRIRGVVDQMPGVLGAAGCDAVATRGREALALVTELNRAFDDETDGGRREGATLFVAR
jgi:predicted secreted Zn-dependent protease